VAFKRRWVGNHEIYNLNYHSRQSLFGCLSGNLKEKYLTAHPWCFTTPRHHFLRQYEFFPGGYIVMKNGLTHTLRIMDTQRVSM
jgi:hypothetical protein